MSEYSLNFLVEKNDLTHVSWKREALAPLQTGQVRLKVDSFALTANNITYATLGDKFGYWKLFPAPPGYGRVPVWGSATIEASRSEGLIPGERVFGCFPISTELVVTVGDLSDLTFRDTAPWRQDVAGFYNRYLRVTDAPAFAGTENESMQAAFRPLFLTSFLIAEFLAENRYFAARSVLISSASSKTSLALAQLLKTDERSALEIVGLTSSENIGFVADTGNFDRISDYDNIANLPIVPTIYVDMAGSAKLRAAIHHHFGDKLCFNSAVGMSHRDSAKGSFDLPGPRPAVFFAPARADQAIDAWGQEAFERRLGRAWNRFQASISQSVEPVSFSGRTAIEAVYLDVLEGRISPRYVAIGRNLTADQARAEA